MGNIVFVFLLLLVSHPIYLPHQSLSLSLLVVTQIRGHIAGSSPSSPLRFRALLFYRDNILGLSYLVHSRRIVLIHARRCPLLIVFLVKFFYASKFVISPRWNPKSQTNTTNSSIRGIPLDHRGDRRRIHPTLAYEEGQTPEGIDVQ